MGAPVSAPLIIPASVIRAAPSEGQSCRGCRWHAVEKPDVVCRRYPPQVTVLMVPAPPPRVGQLQPMPFATFPPVNPDAPCGEWTPQRTDA